MSVGSPRLSQRDRYLRQKYGVTLAWYNELLKKQNNCCAVCLKPPKDGRNLCVDHDHKTGEIRGLLDVYCNRRLVGRHRDGTLLRRIADYVEQGTGWFVPKKKPKKRRKRRRK